MLWVYLVAQLAFTWIGLATQKPLMVIFAAFFAFPLMVANNGAFDFALWSMDAIVLFALAISQTTSGRRRRKDDYK